MNLPDSGKLFQGLDVLLIKDLDYRCCDFVLHVNITFFHNDVASTLDPKLLVELCWEETQQITPVCSLSLHNHADTQAECVQMVQGRPGWFQAPNHMAVSTRLKYIAAPAKLCSDDLLLICGRDKLLLSEVLSTPAHNRDMGTMITRGLRPVDMQAGLRTTKKHWIQAQLTVSNVNDSLCVPVGSLRTDVFALSQSSSARLLIRKIV